MHPVTRTCPCCGSAFTTDNLKRKYCSDTCRNTHQMRKKRARTKARKARIETSAAREALEGKTHLSISEAAKFLGVSRPTLYARIEQGELTPLRVSTRTVRIPIEQLETSTQMQPKPTKGDFSSLISKADVLSKYDISERWLYKCLKEEGIRPKLIKGVSFLPKPDIERMFKPKPVYNPDEWIDAEDLINKEGLTRKYISDFARRKAIPCRRIGRTLLVSKKEWEKAHIFQGDRDKNYLTVDQAKKHYRIGQQTFYDKTNEAGVEGIRQGNRVYYRIVDLDRLFKDKTPKIPAEIRKNYMRSGDALKYYHLGQKRFSEETQAAAYGSAGDLTWYHRNGKCYTRKRSHPVYSGTAGQLEHLDVHRRALAAWRSIPHQTQLEWNALAEYVEPHRPPFDHKANISGQNLFVSAYHGFYTLGNEHLPVPRAFDNFPPYSIDLRDAHVESGTLVIPAVVVLGGEETPGRYRLLAKLQLTTPGKGCHPGMLRNYLADASCDSALVHFRVPDYASIIGSDSTSCQVHGRFILLDNVTGYRSQYQQKSFLLQITQ